MHPKQDDTRAPLAELPWLALTMVAQAIRLGRASNGYAAHAWRAEPIALSRLLSAALRHVAAFLGGADTDQKTGAHHLACAAFNVLAALELHQTAAADVDDRWKAPKAQASNAVKCSVPCPTCGKLEPCNCASAKRSFPPDEAEAHWARYYGLTPKQVRGLWKLRASAAVSIDAGTEPNTEQPIWLATFKANDTETRDVLLALRLLNDYWTSKENPAEAEAKAYEALRSALEARHLATAAPNVTAESIQAAAEKLQNMSGALETIRQSEGSRTATKPPTIEGASAGFAYSLSSTEMEGVRALRVWVEQTRGRRMKDPPEFAEIHAGGATLLGIAANGDSDMWIATFPADTDAKREALQVLGLLGKQWSSWISGNDAKGAATHELNAALEKRRKEPIKKESMGIWEGNQ